MPVAAHDTHTLTSLFALPIQVLHAHEPLALKVAGIEGVLMARII